MTFAEESKAYQALSVLKLGAVQNRLQVRNAAVIARDAADPFGVRDAATDGSAGTGPWVGWLVGILAGPLGVLLGAASGALGRMARQVRQLDRRIGRQVGRLQEKAQERRRQGLRLDVGPLCF